MCGSNQIEFPTQCTKLTAFTPSARLAAAHDARLEVSIYQHPDAHRPSPTHRSHIKIPTRDFGHYLCPVHPLLYLCAPQSLTRQFSPAFGSRQVWERARRHFRPKQLHRDVCKDQGREVVHAVLRQRPRPHRLGHLAPLWLPLPRLLLQSLCRQVPH